MLSFRKPEPQKRSTNSNRPFHKSQSTFTPPVDFGYGGVGYFESGYDVSQPTSNSEDVPKPKDSEDVPGSKYTVSGEGFVTGDPQAPKYKYYDPDLHHDSTRLEHPDKMARREKHFGRLSKIQELFKVGRPLAPGEKQAIGQYMPKSFDLSIVRIFVMSAGRKRRATKGKGHGADATVKRNNIYIKDIYFADRDPTKELTLSSKDDMAVLAHEMFHMIHNLAKMSRKKDKRARKKLGLPDIDPGDLYKFDRLPPHLAVEQFRGQNAEAQAAMFEEAVVEDFLGNHRSPVLDYVRDL